MRNFNQHHFFAFLFSFFCMTHVYATSNQTPFTLKNEPASQVQNDALDETLSQSDRTLQQYPHFESGRLVQSARKKRQEGQREEALKLYQTALQKNHYLISNMLLQEGHQKKHDGQIEEAIVLYKSALAENPGFDAAERSLKAALMEKNLNLFSKTLPQACQKHTQDFNQNLKCATQHFMIGGRPINPMIIKELSSWISDTGDQVTAISLEDSQKSNKFFCEHYTITKEGHFFNVKSSNNPENLDEETQFNYTVHGVTKDGIFILETTDWSGGTGVFSHVLFVRFRQDMAFETGNKTVTLSRNRLLIEKMGEIPLGDRTYSEFTLKRNILTIKTHQRLLGHESDNEEPDTVVFDLSLPKNGAL